MSRRKTYVVIEVAGGLIDTVTAFSNVEKARRWARGAWSSCDYETDDVKVMAVGEPDKYYWMPPFR